MAQQLVCDKDHGAVCEAVEELAVLEHERDAAERKQDFQCIECGMTLQEAMQESSRCLRCDHFGYGIFKGGRVERW